MGRLSKLNMAISASINLQTSLPHACSGARAGMVLLFALIALAGPLWIRPSHAIGPTLPLRFEDLPETKDPWTVSLWVDPEQIRVVRIERHVYADGERLHVESIEAKYERQPIDEHAESRAQLPLRFKEMEDLKQKRAFAQKIIVEGQWLKEPSVKPLYLQRWFYFIVKGDKIERVSIEEYSNFTERAEVSIDSRGRQGLFNPGRDLEAAVSLPDTKGTPAMRVGPMGGAAEEYVPREGKHGAEEIDRSEVDER